MKRIFVVCALAGFLVSCTKKTTDSSAIESNTPVVEQKQEEVVENQKGQKFDIESIAVSDADIGDFPYFTLPSGLRHLNKPLQRNFDVCFFPVDGVMTPFEGKLYKVNIDSEQGEQFSQRYFEKSMEDYLESIGAVKVFDGEITREEYERYNKQDPNKGDEGDIGYAGQLIRFYVVRSAEQGNVYVQYTANNAGATLNILQEAGFKQTITKVKAEDIAKDLTTKGKSVLYINFDVDKATINKEALAVVSEITKALNAESSLHISIEGHTDNTGDSQHNKQLSAKRADAVKETLIKQGITSSRLTSTGYGADKPLVDNNSEENKAKNRRVELIRVK
ncbi:OmpA family protein [Myroides sp. WP-1]|uniref:OmpA family protein n=1 Tax=Myroides sp. WP-1 TaxID=2759944 RepID=UPI0015FC46CA|nr:OmpA family protein [Myroides sp. WP-1]MBB1140486.1 OmpA family protein [Myroides sp. WP-1]